MKKPTEKQIARIAKACQALGAYLFRHESCDPKFDAQRNLQGRSHYADPDTLRGFRARILRAGVVPESGGLLYYLVESVNSRPDHGGENKRAVLFDVFGDVIMGRDEWHRTTDQAHRALAEFLADFDLSGHYREEIKQRVARMRNDASRASRALAGN